MLKHILPFAASLALISGCQTLPGNPGETPLEKLADSQAIPQKPEPTARTRIEPSLMPDVVYSVLAGDIAAQRGAYLIAHKHYLYAARIAKDSSLAELATKAALASQTQNAAEQAVNYWIELRPENTGALQIAALLAAQKKNIDVAVSYLRRVVDIKKQKNEPGYLDVARLLAKIGDSKLRLELMQGLVEGREKDADALFALALVEVGSHNYVRGEELAAQVLGLRPDWNEARVLYVRTLASQDKKEEARESLAEFLRDSPEDIKLRAAYARLLVEQEDLKEAQVQFEKLLEYSPDDGDALFALGIIALQLEQQDRAIKYLQRLHEAGAHRNDAAYYLGQVYEDKGDAKEALRWFGRVRGGNQFDARVRVARIHAEQGRVDEAREILQQLRGHSGKNPVELDLIEGEILRDVEQYKAAMEVLDRSLLDNPDNHELLYARALTAVKVDRLDILEQDLRRILDQDPKHADALNALGYTLADQTDRFEEARSYILRAFALKPESAAILDSMGWVQYRLGNNQDALRYLWRALELLPDAEIAAHLGEVLWAEGERQRALQVWEEALLKEPDSQFLLRMMERYGKNN